MSVSYAASESFSPQDVLRMTVWFVGCALAVAALFVVGLALLAGVSAFCAACTPAVAGCCTAVVGIAPQLGLGLAVIVAYAFVFKPR